MIGIDPSWLIMTVMVVLAAHHLAESFMQPYALTARATVWGVATVLPLFLVTHTVGFMAVAMAVQALLYGLDDMLRPKLPKRIRPMARYIQLGAMILLVCLSPGHG